MLNPYRRLSDLFSQARMYGRQTRTSVQIDDTIRLCHAHLPTLRVAGSAGHWVTLSHPPTLTRSRSLSPAEHAFTNYTTTNLCVFVLLMVFLFVLICFLFVCFCFQLLSIFRWMVKTEDDDSGDDVDDDDASAVANKRI